MSIERIEKKLDRLMAHLGVGETSGGKASSVEAHEGDVATDDDLDGPYGNPELRIPRSEKWVKWADYNGRTMSDAPTDLLRQYARLLEWQAGKDEQENKVSKSGKPTAGYKRQDAARARGWAKRNQGLARSAPVSVTEQEVDGDIPF